MNHLLSIIKKEIREMLTPGSIASIVLVMVLMFAMGNIMQSQTENAMHPVHVGIVNGDTGYDDGTDTYCYGDVAYGLVISYYDTLGCDPSEYVIVLESPWDDREAIIEEMREKGLDASMVVPASFSENICNLVRTDIDCYYIYTNQTVFGSISTMINDTLVAYINTALSTSLMMGQGTINAENVAFYESPLKASSRHTDVNGNICDDITPYEIVESMMGQNMMIPIIIMIVVMMIGSIVISSMGNEKENKTLETLLTLPVKRSTIVTGKILASAIVGLTFGLAYMVGMSSYFNGLTAGTGNDLSQYGLSLSIGDWFLIAASIFLTIFASLTLCMILGAFTKNYKAAQTMTLPVSFMAMLPMFILIFVGWDSLPVIAQALLFLIPFTHPMMAMNNLMFDNTGIVFAGIGYLVLFTAVMVAITVKIYKSDILLTGIGQTRIATAFNRTFKKKRGNKE